MPNRPGQSDAAREEGGGEWREGEVGGAGECEEESRKRGLLGERVEDDLRSWSHCSSHAVAHCMRNTAALKHLGNL